VFVAVGDPKSHAMKKRLWAVSEALLPARRVFDFNQALMDLGALVCTARKPRCLVCPLARNCRAFPFTPAPGAIPGAKARRRRGAGS
jgi:A/G-specific adenine glycosylase